MLLFSLAIALGFILLVWSADRFVLGASATARNLGVQPLIVGMVVMGFGTSAPEMLVSGVAAWGGNPSLGIGNAIGSNIANIALVLGVTALVAPMVVNSKILRREFPILFLVMFLALAVMVDGSLSQLDGVLLILSLLLVMGWMVYTAINSRDSDSLIDEFEEEMPESMSTSRALIWLLVGLLVLLASSRLLVWGATNIAVAMGVSDLVIGLTIVAVGTSLPELAATVMSALKKEHDIAIGNVIGSNIFNLLGVLALPALIHPAAFDADVLVRDFPVMIGLTVALYAMAFGFRRVGVINRWEGLLLLLVFVAYMTGIFFMATGG